MSKRLACSLMLSITLLSLLAGTTVSAAGSIIFVDANASGANNGTSWADAYVNLQSALAAAVSGKQIWVAAGTYKPTGGTDQNATFTLKSGVKIYGGFTGSETLLSERNPSANPTILSGDIGTVDNIDDNSYHVVTGNNANSTALLDGFTITAGNGSYGGGMYNFGGSASPSLTNVTFSGNIASTDGGRDVQHQRQPITHECDFLGQHSQ